MDWTVTENIGSDHLMIEMKANVKTEKQTTKFTNTKNIIKTIIENLDTKFNFNDIDDLEITFTNIINSNTFYDKTKYRPKFWWTEKIQGLWTVKNIKHKLYNKNKTFWQ